jgi:hypothetical protein
MNKNLKNKRNAGYDGIISPLSSDLMQKAAAYIHSLLFFFLIPNA